MGEIVRFKWPSVTNHCGRISYDCSCSCPFLNSHWPPNFVHEFRVNLIIFLSSSDRSKSHDILRLLIHHRTRWNHHQPATATIISIHTCFLHLSGSSGGSWTICLAKEEQKPRRRRRTTILWLRSWSIESVLSSQLAGCGCSYRGGVRIEKHEITSFAYRLDMFWIRQLWPCAIDLLNLLICIIYYLNVILFKPSVLKVVGIYDVLKMTAKERQGVNICSLLVDRVWWNWSNGYTK